MNYGFLGKRMILGACVVQLIVTMSVTFFTSFMSLFLTYELGLALTEATFWSGILLLLRYLCMGIFSPLWGWMSDRSGARSMLIRVIVTHSIVLGLLAVSRNVYDVLVLSIVQGMLGGTSTIVMALIAANTKPESLHKALSYQQMAQTMGNFLGPAIGAFLASILGFRPAFIFASMMIATTLSYVFATHLPEGGRIQIERRTFSHDLRGLWRILVAIVFMEMSFTYLLPIIPLQLLSLGIEEIALTNYTGLVAGLSGLAYGISTTFMTRVVRRSQLPLLIFGISVTIILQATTGNLYLFLALRLVQSVIFSGVLPHLLGTAGQRKGKGLALGILNAGRFLGDGFGPFIASTSAYTFGMTAPFMIMGLMTMLSIFLVRDALKH